MMNLLISGLLAVVVFVVLFALMKAVLDIEFKLYYQDILDEEK